MTPREPRRTLAHDPDVLGDAENILRRYPDVTGEERDRVGHFLCRGAPIDIGLLSSNPELWRRAERFRGDHPEYFRISRRVYAGWAGTIIAIIVVLILIKDMGLN